MLMSQSCEKQRTAEKRAGGNKTRSASQKTEVTSRRTFRRASQVRACDASVCVCVCVCGVCVCVCVCVMCVCVCVCVCVWSVCMCVCVWSVCVCVCVMCDVCVCDVCVWSVCVCMCVICVYVCVICVCVCVYVCVCVCVCDLCMCMCVCVCVCVWSVCVCVCMCVCVCVCVWVAQMKFSLRVLQKSQKIIVIVARGVVSSICSSSASSTPIRNSLCSLWTLKTISIVFIFGWCVYGIGEAGCARSYS